MYYLLLAFFLNQGQPIPAHLLHGVTNFPTTYSTASAQGNPPVDPNDPGEPGDHEGGDKGQVRPPRPKK